jgi:hypothetical protein
MLQFAYSYIPTAPSPGHRFLYMGNTSLKRRFRADAAAAGIRFDPAFYHAAFEDSELAYRLIPRGLEIRYAPAARVAHDYWMDLDSFMERERRAGAMAVVFYRKHPVLDEHLQVRWIADLVKRAAALTGQPGLLGRLEAFDRETDTLLRSFAASLDGLTAIGRQPDVANAATVPNERVRTALHAIFAVVFDVQRTRGKVTEWFSNVDHPDAARAARILGSVMRTIEFLTSGAAHMDPLRLAAPFDAQALGDLRGRLAEIPGVPWSPASALPGSPREYARRFLLTPTVLSRLIRLDRFLEAHVASALGGARVARYRRARRRVKTFFLP